MRQKSSTWCFVLAGLLACAGPSAFSQSSSTMEDDLRHSQFCAKAAADFRKQPDWSSSDEHYSFTSHFSKSLGKCLVKVKNWNLVLEMKTVLETEHVYDALEGTVLGGRIITKERPHKDGTQKTISTLMVRDGKTLGKNAIAEAIAASEWFDTLMTN